MGCHVMPCCTRCHALMLCELFRALIITYLALCDVMSCCYTTSPMLSSSRDLSQEEMMKTVTTSSHEQEAPLYTRLMSNPKSRQEVGGCREG
jgi:hypothetical protein